MPIKPKISGGESTPFPIYDQIAYVAKSVISDIPDGSLAKPFNTIQAAIDKFGPATNATEYQKNILIDILEPGTYTENLIVPHRAITIKGRGIIINGTITREIADEEEFGVSSSTWRACLTLLGLYSGQSTHQDNRGGIKVIGTYRATVKSGKTGNTTHDASFTNVRFDGSFQVDNGVINGGAPSVGNHVTWLENCRIKNEMIGGVYIHRALNCRFEHATLAPNILVMFDNCIFDASAPMTLTANDVYNTEKFNFTGCFFSNVTLNLTAAGKTAYLDNISLTSWIAGVTLGTNPPTVAYLGKSTALGYTPGTPANWAAPAPITTQQAIDRMASLLVVHNLGVPIP